MAPVPCIKLNTGAQMPVIGLGTWKSKEGAVTEAVKAAIDAGYRHIDGAWAYGNEAEVGAGIKTKIDAGVVKREDLFVVTKVWNTFHSKDLVQACLKDSLALLGLNYVDLCLVHWPMGYKEGGEKFPRDADGNVQFSDVDYVETWNAMEECVKLGLTKAIGVSNFNKEQLDRIIANSSTVPANLQIEIHPYLVNSDLIEYCKSKGIAVTAYSPLGSPDRPWAKAGEPVLMEDPKIVAIAKKYNKTAAQILLRFQLQRGIAVIPKSVTPSRIASNFDVFGFELSDEDMKTIMSFDCNGRVCVLECDKAHKHFPF